MTEVFMICWQDPNGTKNSGKPFKAMKDDAAEAIDELNREWPLIKHWLEKQWCGDVDGAEDEVRRHPSHR
jgi:hypothetical protein